MKRAYITLITISFIIIMISIALGIKMPSIYYGINNITNYMNLNPFPLTQIVTGEYNTLDTIIKLGTLPIDTLFWLVRLLINLK